MSKALLRMLWPPRAGVKDHEIAEIPLLTGHETQKSQKTVLLALHQQQVRQQLKAFF